ncbi:intein-containing Rv2578c family radical SAM protein [Trebonia sp.]|uniref:intein-containing Rv2578c family radical SAM protein n=1 Tax=Trebonia sp. TaxID=2767075 RepID=UPI0026065A23|nr:intein-containing Rv2578c family radical SAM protein [Trebonia sp.]
MRWDNLRLDAVAGSASPDDGGQVPMFERGAVVRTFDTPGFRGMTFYEIQAKSIVSRVPEASRMPFRWTINPYRGCQHSCVYCAWGETPILMGDGTTRPIADVRVGDAIYGTVQDGPCRRYAVTEVLAHWSTVKPAYRITLADGTRLVTSADHRFLTERGWKHVTGAGQGPEQRPFLTPSNKLMGVGAFADPPKDSTQYRRGYLCGMIGGDASLGHRRRPRGDACRFGLALADTEALTRTRRYLGTFGILATEADLALAGQARGAVRATATASRGNVRAIEHLIAWPTCPCEDWFHGFLAGIFDAEGSHSRGTWRVSSTDPQIITWTTRALDVLGFDHVLEPPDRPDGLAVVRLRGGLREVMRFFHATDPAITRKRSIEGAALKGDARLRVAAIEPLGIELPMFDITTGTGDFIANGVVSHNCFARNTHTYLDLDAGRDFDTKVVVKVNAPELLRKKLASPGWTGEHIAMGTNVDCYQRAEGRYQLMRGIIAALRDAANPFSILTKGTLILRDLDLLLEAAEVTDVGLNVSAAFVDKSLWRAIEPGTPAPERRLQACATLNDNGLPCGVLMGPVVPYLSDSPAQLAAAVKQIAEAGASHVTPIVLHLRPGAREWFLGWLRGAHPDLVGRYAALYRRGAYAPKDYQAGIAAQVRELADRYGVGRRGPRQARALPRSPAVRPSAPSAPPVPAGHEQLSLL